MALSNFISRPGCHIDELTFPNFSTAKVSQMLDIDALKCTSHLDMGTNFLGSGYGTSMWKRARDGDAARVRLESRLPFPDDVKVNLDNFCYQSRCSEIRVSYGDQPIFWEYHLIDDLELDLE
ncbi:hypothetical protein BKA70DRAFT_1427453 [Coprinopsis sp. MPI-PUGE-AT-0042]|nr:hypothetical protein BKA70DRAFT_1427453 [Coprinopsis sp. MPI-PUGE-AT-0042]